VAVRWHAVLTLGRFFSVVVAVQPGHRVVQDGLYRHIRTPLLGVLLALLGAGLGLNNALSLAVLLLPVSLALAYRMRVEEQALSEALGEEYRSYCRRTRRLSPGLY
jgi:protein-S-isoprenylcysteine O-methyltransferase